MFFGFNSVGLFLNGQISKTLSKVQDSKIQSAKGLTIPVLSDEKIGKGGLLFGIVIWLCFFFTSRSIFSQPITRHAVLVGVGDYSKESKWPTLHSDLDAKRMANALKTKGFLNRNLHLLINEDATLENIRLTLKRVLNEAEPEDQVFLFFSGHSQQITDISGEEVDGLDEAFACFNSRPRFQNGVYEGQAHLLDDELSRWLSRLAEKVTRMGSVFVFYDGGISRQSKSSFPTKGPFNSFKTNFPSKSRLANPTTYDNEWIDFQFNADFSQVVSIDPGEFFNCNVREIKTISGEFGSPLVAGFLKAVKSNLSIRFRDLLRELDSHFSNDYCQPKLDGAIQQEIFQLEKERQFSSTWKEQENPESKVFSITVGVSHYQNIDPLQYGHKDALMFYSSMQSIFHKLAKPENQFLFIDSMATIKPIIQALETITSRVSEGDKVYFYFAGHGDVENLLTRKAHLLLYNSPSHVYKAGGTLPVEDVKDYLAQWIYKKARVVLVVDACKSGRLAGGLEGQGAAVSSLAEIDKLSVRILSCQPNERSEESDEFGGGHGAFTYYLVKGLSGKANLNGDNQITVKEMEGFLIDSVSVVTSSRQNPLVEGNKGMPIFPGFSNPDFVASPAGSHQNSSIQWLSTESDDSLKNRWVRELQRQLSAKAILVPEDACAKNTFERISNTFPLDKRLLSALSLEIQNAIDKKSQELINEYILGNESLAGEELFAQSARELAYLLEFMEVSDQLYFMYLSRKYFFEGRAIKPRLVKNDLNRFKLAEAIKNLQSSLKYEPEAAQNYNAIGRLRQANLQFEEALVSYRKAIQLAPRWKFPLNNLATAFNEYAQIKNKPKLLDSAVFYYQLALEIDPQFAVAHKNLGKTLVDQGKISNAKKQYLKAIFTNPSFADSYQNLGDLYRQEQKWDSAMYYFRTGLTVRPDHPDILTNIGNVFYEQVSDKAPERARLLNEAKKYYLQAFFADSLCIDANLGLGNVFWELKKYDSASIYYERTTILDSTNLSYKNYYIETLMRLGKLDKADNLSRKMSIKFSGDPTNWFDYGVIAILQKKESIGLSRFRKAIALGLKDKTMFEGEELLDGFRKTKAYLEVLEWLK